MTEELKIAIQNLYDTFSIYPFKSTIEGCPCCVSDTDKEKIHSKQLKELNEDDLSRYAFKAMQLGATQMTSNTICQEYLSF